ncbi:flavin reductase family protein [Ectobacillus ponti]|uniref:Flavin reductase family protein n=1 Tax=Ectobacillus ponti TaxID=2961894 RepID=A0AA41XDS9_9BACI|nr:flavin reductase family protein [Ectobacillus ponti]MCP8971070.1 flavin reductase family protein [Ectobacillus ponti]
MNNEATAAFKQIMGSYPTGVTVVTTTGADGTPAGLTVNSFASVSLDPLLVLWCLDNRSSALAAFSESDVFAVHVLAAEQQDVCWAFAGKEPDRFGKVEWAQSEHGLPVISGSLGVLQCRKVQQMEAGDHQIFLGEVIAIEKEEKEPMLYFRRHVGKIPEHWPV